MTKVAFIDLDGVVANADARFALAEQTANAKHDQVLSRGSWTDLYWRTVFTPEHLTLDTLIDGAKDALYELEQEGYQTVFLTSRPEHMREATQRWLFQHELEAPEDWLVMKPAAFQYVKTVVWKAGTIMQLAAMLGADEVLVIDDEQMNLDELQQYSHPFKLKCCKSLALSDGKPHDERDDLPF